MGVMAACTVTADAVTATRAVEPSAKLKAKFVDCGPPTSGTTVMEVKSSGDTPVNVHKFVHAATADTWKTLAEATHA